MTAAWYGGWTPDTAPRIAFDTLGAAEGDWSVLGRSPIERRDLGLAAASGGKLGGAQIRNTGGSDFAIDWHCHDNDLHFVYVLAGEFTLELEDGAAEVLRAGSSGALPALVRHKEYEFSTDFEALLVTAPAAFETIQGLDADLPRERDPSARAVVTHESPAAYVVGAGPRTFFRYRDLGVREVTNDRVHIHVVRATAPGEGTGWHYHTMSQWFMVLDGEGAIAVEDRPRQPLRPLDSMCLGAGPDQRHDVGPISADYGVIELCVPAEYDTIAVDPPVGAGD